MFRFFWQNLTAVEPGESKVPQRRSLTKWFTSGLEISWLWNGGIIFGSTKVLLLFTNMELSKLLFQDNIITRPPRTVLYNRKVGILRIIFKEENWDTENQQIYSDIIYSLNRDVVSTSRPIIADVRNPDEITAAFDWVIYQKGSSVIHMIKEPFTSTEEKCPGIPDGYL